MHRIAAVLNLLTQLNKSSINNFIRHECQNGILGGCFFILFDGYGASYRSLTVIAISYPIRTVIQLYFDTTKSQVTQGSFLNFKRVNYPLG